jgi:flagellar hook-associated protein 3 FlgL
MMRITNGMMTSNTKNNININKLNEDRLNTQIATGQVISRPSEDPVVAIRALRLNTNLSQLTQYYKKNIPDAQAWMNVTETALKQTNQIFTNIKENLTTGASDDNTATDRQKILESLKGLRAELYSSGNADYAERTVFTGYRTGESLTFLATDTDLNSEYMIHETFDAKALDTFNYITSDPGDETKVTQNEINRIRLSYDNIMSSGTPTSITLADGSTPISVTMKSISGESQATIDNIYTSVPDNEAYLIPETGELILGKTAASNYANAAASGAATFEYTKNQWNSGDLRPEHYFACTQTTGTPAKKTYFNYDLKDDGTGKMVPDPTKPNFVNQNMEVEISFNQKITINTHANEVYTHDIGREIDDLLRVTQDVVDAEEKVTAAEKKLAAASEADKATVQKELDAANKEFSLKKSRMQKMFSEGLDKFDGYADRNNVAIANIGSLQSRLSITKERVADQLQSFKELADNNINAELTESSIDFSNAKLALEAAQLAAGKISQQTLLNYL